MKELLAIYLYLSLIALSLSARAASPTLTDIGATAPTPGANDEYQLSTGTDSDFLNYYFDNNPPPGQTFTTGGNAGGYILNTLFIATVGNSGGSLPAQGQAYSLYVYSVSDTTATLLTNYISQGNFAFTDRDWLQWTNLGLILLPNSLYAYAFQRNTQGWEQLSAVCCNPYPGGQICLIPMGGGTMTFGKDHNRSASFDIGLILNRAVGSLTFTTQPVDATAGATIPSCVVKAWTGANGTGSPVSGVSVSLTLSAGSFGAGSTTTVTTDANGLATFSNVNITTAGSYTLTASDGAGHTVQSTASFTITAGGAHQLGFGVQPGTTTVGSAISPAVTVLVQDQYGNTVTTDSSSVTIAGTTFAAGSTLTVAAVNGVAAFSNITPMTVGSITLTAGDGSLTGATSSAFTVNAPPANYYVNSGGVDSAGRDGFSIGTAWATLSYALSRIPAGTPVSPQTIHMGAGTFRQTSSASLPSWVNLRGNGTSSTFINATYTNSASYFANPTLGGQLLVITNGGNNVISDISFSGNNRNTGGAFYVENASNLLFQNVAFTNFGSCVLMLMSNCACVTVSNAAFSECGYEDTNQSLGAIQILQLQDSLFTHIAMVSSLPGTGYGFKNSATISQFSGSAQLVRTIFDNLNISLKPIQAYQNAGYPNFAMEFWNAAQTNNELRYSSLFNTVSQSSADYTMNGTNSTMRIHDNSFILQWSAYAIEMKTHRLEVDHNYFTGGYCVMDDFTAGMANMQGFNIHHNVAEAVGLWFFGFEGAPMNLRMWNNTVYFLNATGNTNHVFLNNGNESSAVPGGWDLRNNITVAPAAFPGAFYYVNNPNSLVPTNVVCSNNIYLNMSFAPPTGSTTGFNTNTDPALNLYGLRPDWYYRPASLLSTAVDYGASNGVSFCGSAPDAGAYELTPNYVLQAESAVAYGPPSNSITVFTNHGTGQIGNCNDGDWVQFPGIDFSGNLNAFRTHYSNGNNSGTFWLEVHLDSANGPIVSTLTNSGTGSWSTFVERKSGILPTNGVHGVYIVFRGGSGVGNFDWFEFNHEPLYLEAEKFSIQNNDRAVVVNSNASGGYLGATIGYVNNGCWIAFSNIDLSTQPGWVNFRYGSGSTGNNIYVRMDSISGPLLANYSLLNTGDYSTFAIDGTNMDTTKLPSGTSADPSIRTVYFVFSGGYGIGDVDWIEFDRTATTTPAKQPTTLSLGSSSPRSAFGASVTFTATIQTNGVMAANASGNVIFFVDGAAMATNNVTRGLAAYSTSNLSGGVHIILAQFNGDSAYYASAGSIPQTVYYFGASEISAANGVVSIEFYGKQNQVYVVQTTSNLWSSWWPISTNTAGTNGSWWFIDANASNLQQYYRLVLH